MAIANNKDRDLVLVNCINGIQSNLKAILNSSDYEPEVKEIAMDLQNITYRIAKSSQRTGFPEGNYYIQNLAIYFWSLFVVFFTTISVLIVGLSIILFTARYFDLMFLRNLNEYWDRYFTVSFWPIAFVFGASIFLLPTAIDRSVRPPSLDNIESLEKRLRQSLKRIEDIPKFDTSSFKCLGDFERCKLYYSGNQLLCMVLCISCVVQSLVPFAGKNDNKKEKD